MNAPADFPLSHTPAMTDAIHQACARIAPTWPLDQFIAVNPYWGWVGTAAPQAAAALGALAGTRLTVSRADLVTHWNAARLTTGHLHAAIDRPASPLTARELAAARRQIDRQRLSLPPGDNAMQSLREAHDLAPREPALPRLADEVVAFYAKRVNDAVAAGKDDEARENHERIAPFVAELKREEGKPWVALRTSLTKRVTRPPKKHGLIPL